VSYRYIAVIPRIGEPQVSNIQSQIRDCIDRDPGIHFNAISRELDIATGQTQYHLRKLTGAGKLEKESISGRTHYFPPTFSAWERSTIALLRRETTREIVMYLLRQQPAPPAKIASNLEHAATVSCSCRCRIAHSGCWLSWRRRRRSRSCLAKRWTGL